ncbi:hypothetical protein LO771_27665 [Streptacidiphilus sp. ASG 303]|uniref:hypothetical protein n=1 Tax=Streptacidiphilus sp. ASG 303 TaxID=2896847 RepID=UPI001E3E155D|nr:hypothetical protein [Streptacidiphilus sp. ASG 303]MCD0486062.1 hypothetical protein [Streptacidiphilus sp. ASG 303]
MTAVVVPLCEAPALALAALVEKTERATWRTAAVLTAVVPAAVWGRPSWPKPQYADQRRMLRRLRTTVTGGPVVGGLLIGILAGIAGTYLHVPGSWPWHDPAGGLVQGVLAGMVIDVARTFRAGQASGHQDGTLHADACRVIRGDWTSRLSTALLIGLVADGAMCAVAALAGVLPHSGSLPVDVAVMLIAGLVLGLVFGCGNALAVALASRFAGGATVRYLAFLAGSRTLLPWRLGRFMECCYDLGILRISGTAHQFRHRELQDHLAAHPRPPRP